MAVRLYNAIVKLKNKNGMSYHNVEPDKFVPFITDYVSRNRMFLGSDIDIVFFYDARTRLPAGYWHPLKGYRLK